MKTTTDGDVVVNEEVDIPAPAPVSGTDDALNKLFAALLPVLNKALVKAIVDAEGDPWKEVIVPPNGIVTLGKVEIPLVGTAKAEASYTVKNMKGLSSLVITAMTPQTVKDPVTSKEVNKTIKPNPRTVTGTLSVSAKLSKDLTGTVGGAVSVSVNNDKVSIGLSGKAIAKTVTGTSKGVFTATIGYPKSCFTVLELSDFRLNYADIDVDIPNDFGIYDYFLNPLVDQINKQYGSEIKGKISVAVQPQLNDLLKSVLPLCVDVVTGNRI